MIFLLLSLTSLVSTQNINGANGYTVAIDSASSFCLIIPSAPGTSIAASDASGISACFGSPVGAKPTRSMPNGMIVSSHFVRTEHYTQVTGTYDGSVYGLSASDTGTQWDNSLKSQGGVLPQSGCAGSAQYLEFFGSNVFCLRCCKDAFSSFCNPSDDTQGCYSAFGAGADFSPSGFTNNGVRVNGSPPTQVVGSVPAAQSTPVSAYLDCSPVTDSCKNGFVCCQSSIDVKAGEGKTTCRPSNDCASGGKNPFVINPAPVSNGISPFNNCNVGVDSCSGGFTCCVGVQDASSGKSTCRKDDCLAVKPSVTTTISLAPTGVPAWSNCRSGDSCATNGFVCCTAPADVFSNKMTCRAANDCAATSGNLIQDWFTCSATNDKCQNAAFKCCVAKGDVSSGKTTCRDVSTCS